MADIQIIDNNGTVLETLRSGLQTTVEDLLDMIGRGALRRDGELVANKKYVLEAGTYMWSAKQQQITPPHDADKEDMRKRIVALEMKDSRAVSYSEQFLAWSYHLHAHPHEGEPLENFWCVWLDDCAVPILQSGEIRIISLQPRSRRSLDNSLSTTGSSHS